MASAKKLKAELLKLRMSHPQLLAEFNAAKKKLWRAEERMDRIQTELAMVLPGTEGGPDGR